MNENDIRKALDWCEQFENNIVFKGNGDERCALALQAMVVIKHALKNYNRQKAEIEELKEDNKQFANHLVERGDFIEKVRAEAIKEFAERFLEIVHNNHYLLRTNLNSTDYGMFTLGIEQALNEAKEMVGERE